MRELISRYIPIDYWREACLGAGVAAIWTTILVVVPGHVLISDYHWNSVWAVSAVVFGILSGLNTASAAKTRIMQEGIDWYCEKNGL